VSRVGKQPIKIPDGVSASVKEGIFSAKSSKGQLEVPLMEGMNVAVDSSLITVTHTSEDKNASAYWGLTRALLNNVVVGLSTGWEKTLEVRGVGYRAQLKGKVLDLQIGQSHPILIDPPKGITFETSQESIEGNNVQIIKISGVDKQLVGDVAAKIRALKPPEPYKGKGVRYRGEYVRRKAGKATG
jgi:large subunit ribosomal protein L6